MFEKQKKHMTKWVKRLKKSHWVLFFIAILLLSVSLHPRLITRSFEIPAEGEIATRVIKAPRDFWVENEMATQQRREEALKQILPVYDYISNQAERIDRKMENAFTVGRAAILASAQEADTDAQTKTLAERALESKKPMEQILGFPISDEVFLALANAHFSSTITDVIVAAYTPVYGRQIVANVGAFEEQLKNGIVVRDLRQKTEARETEHPEKVESLERERAVLEDFLRSQLKGYPDLPTDAVMAFARTALEPNLKENHRETALRQQLAMDVVRPVMFEIKANETIVRDGDRVTPYQIKLLQTLQAQDDVWKDVSSTIGAFFLLATLFLLAWFVYLRNLPAFKKEGSRERNLLFLLVSLVFFFLFTEFGAYLSDVAMESMLNIPSSAFAYGLPLAAATMLVCLFLGPSIAFPFAVVMSILASMVFRAHMEIFVYTLIGSAAAGYWATNCRERKKFIGIGVRLGLLNMGVALLLSLYSYDLSLHKILLDSIFAFGSGLGAAIITLGLAPLIEVWFGFTTDVTLLELSNLDKPLLRRLMIEAPGTYHHSVIVGTMVESAAADIGANGLLAKVCGYYHDIGKLNKPMYFIENQTNDYNPHNKLSPSMSALILIAHVKHGVEIGKEYKLGPAILDAIQQHHGTSLIQYFYEKACTQKRADEVSKNDFSYPGSKPQTKEAALLMLADVVEAASRTMTHPTPIRIQALVETLINKIFTDGQLSECDLTLKDLNKIAKRFTKILTGIHHHRIEYAETAELTHAGNTKDQNGHSDRKSPAKNADTSKTNSNHGDGADGTIATEELSVIRRSDDE